MAATSDSNTGIFFIILMYVFTVGTLVPGIAVTVRRLHDTGRSGAYYFLALIPFVGGIVLLVFLCEPSSAGAGALPTAVQTPTVTPVTKKASPGTSQQGEFCPQCGSHQPGRNFCAQCGGKLR
jgi:hypothetical protein